MFRFVIVCLVFHATGLHGFDVSTSTPDLRVPENAGADLKCTYSADFGSDARVEWKFKNLQGSQTYVFFSGHPTAPYKGRVTKYEGGLRFNKVTRNDNGEYDCEVSGSDQFKEAKIKLTVLVPPSVPVARIPSSVTTGGRALLTCFDKDGSPPPTYRWFKNKTPLPQDPSKFPAFNYTVYKISPQNGTLLFPKTTKMDSGEYYCEASNGVGDVKRSQTVKMEVRDVNVGGIVAGVIFLILILILLVVAVWFAYKRGYLAKFTERKPKSVVYTQPTSDYGDEEDGEFRQKSSFVV
ncbi:F11 receptor, tandem duplicate 1 [Chanos chanos]|uniref:Junctional adhesion molecule A n=1 Tax=Chanos chanos TaxID=29144 RepID=A0A6J2WVP8_CHACN|nr:junctional adhesion molecule A [Chanos chanos]